MSIWRFVMAVEFVGCPEQAELMRRSPDRVLACIEEIPRRDEVVELVRPGYRRFWVTSLPAGAAAWTIVVDQGKADKTNSPDADPAAISADFCARD